MFVFLKTSWSFTDKWVFKPINKAKYVIGTIAFFVFSINWGTQTVSDLRSVKPNDFGATVIESIENTENCTFDESKWLTGYGELVKNEKNDSYILSSTTQSSLLQFKQSLESKDEIEFTFVPLSLSESNVAILAHELFEITVGDGSNRRITVKAKLAGHRNMVPIAAEHAKEKSFLLPEEFAVGREVSVRVIPSPNSQNEEELIVTVYYYSDERSTSRESVTKGYKFPIPDEFKNSDRPIRVSIGILNTDNKEDIEARFKCFRISAADDNSSLSYLRE